MKIRDVLEYVIELKEPAFSEKTLLRWINQIEAEIQTEVLLLAASGIVRYTMDDLDAELIAPPPFDKLYEDYLIWRIDLAQEEAERANNSQTVYNESYLAYVRFVCETINPGDGKAEDLRYYLTAYQLAKKYGFSGTEKEWVESLKGKNGEPGAGVAVAYDEASGTVEVVNISGNGGSGSSGGNSGNGEPGVGIADIVLKNETEAGNVYRVILTDGTEREITAPAGPRGLRGLQGEPGAGVAVDYDDDTGTVEVVNISGSGGSGGNGTPGVGIYEIAFKEATEAGNVYTIVLTNGNEYEFTAPKGPKGDAGTTPVKGKDYFTAAEKEAFIDAVLEELPDGGGNIQVIDSVESDSKTDAASAAAVKKAYDTAKNKLSMMINGHVLNGSGITEKTISFARHLKAYGDAYTEIFNGCFRLTEAASTVTAYCDTTASDNNGAFADMLIPFNAITESGVQLKAYLRIENLRWHFVFEATTELPAETMIWFSGAFVR